MKQLTKGHSLPDKDVTFRAYKFNALHKSLMHCATRWAKNKDCFFTADIAHCEAIAYKEALLTTLIGTVPDEVFEEICEEYRVMLLGKEVDHGKDQ